MGVKYHKTINIIESYVKDNTYANVTKKARLVNSILSKNNIHIDKSSALTDILKQLG